MTENESVQQVAVRSRYKLHKRYTPWVFAFYMALIMAFLMCCVIVLANGGAAPWLLVAGAQGLCRGHARRLCLRVAGAPAGDAPGGRHRASLIEENGLSSRIALQLCGTTGDQALDQAVSPLLHRL